MNIRHIVAFCLGTLILCANFSAIAQDDKSLVAYAIEQTVIDKLIEKQLAIQVLLLQTVTDMEIERLSGVISTSDRGDGVTGFERTIAAADSTQTTDYDVDDEGEITIVFLDTADVVAPLKGKTIIITATTVPDPDGSANTLTNLRKYLCRTDIAPINLEEAARAADANELPLSVLASKITTGVCTFDDDGDLTAL